MRVVICPYKMSSKSAKDLARGLGVLRVYRDRKYRKRIGDLAINWGNSTPANWGEYDLNPSHVAAVASNKLSTFQALSNSGVSTPEWTTDQDIAYDWLTTEYTVQAVARTTLTGRSGRGIIEIMGGTEYGPEGRVWPQAPLYTKVFPKEREFRVHVFNGVVIDVTEKVKRNGTGSRQDHLVWNHGNDYVFVRENIDCPDVVKEQAIKAMNAIGLDFGAADIGYASDLGAVVFEVNTAPGLAPTTLSKYVEVINEYR